MASFNAAATLADALQSVTTQTLRDIEILVVDDASSDTSAALVAAIALRDPRVRLLRSPVRGGPSRARNLGLDHATGRWIAIMDSDDLMHPERLQRLLHAAETHGSDIAADNLLVFNDDRSRPSLFDRSIRAPRQIALADYVLANAYGRRGPKSGYLKPLIRTAFLHHAGVRYEPALLVAQDFSFVRRLLAAGAVFHVFPEPLYFYRKHAASNSHRVSRTNIEAMMTDDATFLAQSDAAPPALHHAIAIRRDGFQRALAFDDLVQAIKTRQWRSAATLAIQQPRAAFALWHPVASRLARPKRRPVRANPPRHVCLLGVATTLLAPWFARPGLQTHRVAIPTRHGLSPAAKLFIAHHARPVADIVAVAGTAGLEALPFVLRTRSPAIVLVTEPTPNLSRATVIISHQPLAAAIRLACPGTPIILLATRALYDGVRLPADLTFLVE